MYSQRERQMPAAAREAWTTVHPLLNPKPIDFGASRNPKPETRNCKPETRNLNESPNPMGGVGHCIAPPRTRNLVACPDAVPMCPASCP